MKIAYKALWLVESRLAEPIVLKELAAELGVSEFHLARAFFSTIGMSLMQYVRLRRLTEAARKLEDSNTSIINIALDSAYGSHEAFTRAFKEVFGRSPQVYRSEAPNNGTNYLEAVKMESKKDIGLEKARIERCGEMKIIGLKQRYGPFNSANIPEQWARFNQLDLQVPAVTFGVCYNSDNEGNMDYLCGFEVDDSFSGASGLEQLTLALQTYAVFAHKGHVSEIRDVWQAIWSHGLEDAGVTTSEGPDFERYGPEFDPESGNGGYEIWVPIEDVES